MRTPIALFAAIVGFVACSDSLSLDSPEPIPAHGVLMTVTDSGSIAAGEVMRIHLVNGGAGTAYLQRCGPGPRLGTETFADGGWQPEPPIGIACIQGPPGPVVILARDSLVLSLTYSLPGIYRVVAGISSVADFSDAARASSNAFTIR